MTSIIVKTSLAALVAAGASAIALPSAQALPGGDRGLATTQPPIAEKAGWGCGPYGCRRGWGGYGYGYGYGGHPRYWGGGGYYGYRPRHWGGYGWGGPRYGWGGHGYGWGHHW